MRPISNERPAEIYNHFRPQVTKGYKLILLRTIGSGFRYIHVVYSDIFLDRYLLTLSLRFFGTGVGVGESKTFVYT